MPSEESVAQVVVAAWGPAFGYPATPVFDGEQFSDQGAVLSYEARAKVVIDATLSTSLGEVIDDAAKQFGVLSRDERAVSEQVPCVAFFQEGDQAGMAGDPERWYYAVRTVDSMGSPSWAVRWSEMHLEELVTARSAGLINGDPLRPYFWPVIPQGVLADVASSIFATWAMWEHYLSARETVGIARRVLERIPGLLFGMGYVIGHDGRWRPGDDPAAGVLREGVIEIKKLGHGPEGIAEAANRVRSLVEQAEQTQPPR